MRERQAYQPTWCMQSPMRSYTTGSSEVVLGRPVTPERSAKMGGYVTQAMNVRLHHSHAACWHWRAYHCMTHTRVVVQRLFPSNGPSVNPEHRKQMYDAALVLAPELRSTEPGFNCLDVSPPHYTNPPLRRA